jgi:hypothetical protein
MAALSKPKDLRIALVILYGIAMLLLPLAHLRMAWPGAGLPAIEQAYPDGSFPILCLSGQTAPGKTQATIGCVAWTLVDAPGLPFDTAENMASPLVSASRITPAAPAQVDPSRSHWPPSQPRAPPTT